MQQHGKKANTFPRLSNLSVVLLKSTMLNFEFNLLCFFFRAEMERGLSRKHILEGKIISYNCEFEIFSPSMQTLIVCILGT